MSLMFLPLAPPGKPICGTEGSGETVLFEKFTSSTHPFIASTNIFLNLSYDFGNSLDPWSEREIDSLLEIRV